MAWTYLRARSVRGFLAVVGSALVGGNRAATKADLESLGKHSPTKTIVLSLHGLAWVCLGFVLQALGLLSSLL